MPLERRGKTYLNAQESSGKDFLNVSFSTFQKIERDYGLKAKTFIGQGRQKFFLKSAVELIRDNAVEDRERVKEQIKALQEAGLTP